MINLNQMVNLLIKAKPTALDGEAMPSEAEMIQDIIKKFQVPKAVIGMHEGMIVESNLGRQRKHD